MAGEPVRVLFLAGTGRSGSTILSKLLGSCSDVFAAGEVRYLWSRGLAENRSCGCGVALRDCPTWRAILEDAFTSVDRVPVDELAMLASRVVRIRNLPTLVATTSATGRLPKEAQRYADTLATLYRSIRDVTGAKVIVDSSKLPAYGFVLDQISSIDLRVAHVVRDPRAAAYSWMQSDERHGASEDPMDRFSPLKSSGLWDFWNAFVVARWRRRGHSTLVRYEDFMAAPRETAARLMAFAGVPDSPLPFSSDDEAVIACGHLVAGNPVRGASGSIQFRNDDEWKRRMPRRTALSVTAMTAPLLRTLGYELGAAR